jgi:hypothetical protein
MRNQTLLLLSMVLSQAGCFALMQRPDPNANGQAETQPIVEEEPSGMGPGPSSRSGKPQAGQPSGAGHSGQGRSSGSAPPSPPPAGPVSASIRSQCKKTVKVFYGKDPKFGSGTRSSVSSNSVSSHSFSPGEMFWVVDDSDRGLGSVTPSANAHNIEIGADCASVSLR